MGAHRPGRRVLEGKAWLSTRWRQRGRKIGRRQGKETDLGRERRKMGKDRMSQTRKGTDRQQMGKEDATTKNGEKTQLVPNRHEV